MGGGGTPQHQHSTAMQGNTAPSQAASRTLEALTGRDVSAKGKPAKVDSCRACLQDEAAMGGLL